MTKRSTEEVLRAEVKSAAKELEKAQARTAAKREAETKAKDELVAAITVQRLAYDALERAEAALEAFLPKHESTDEDDPSEAAEPTTES